MLDVPRPKWTAAQIGHLKVETFKITNRTGFAASARFKYLKEGAIPPEANECIVKALRRITRRQVI